MGFSQINNFYRFSCDVLGQRPAYAACLGKIRRIAAETDKGLWPECETALGKGLCRAAQMMAEEMAKGAALYYVDRDDAGPGVLSRAQLGQPERTKEERAQHHAILKLLGRIPDERKVSEFRVPETGPAPRIKERPAKAKPGRAFDLAGLITEAVAEIHA